MVIAKMLGGLGNQMFCYAFARNLQLRIGGNLFLDCSAYKKYKIRNYSLDKLSIPPTVKKVNNLSEIGSSISTYEILRKLYHIYYKLKKELMHTDVIGEDLFNFLGKRGLYYNLDRYFYSAPSTKNKIKFTYGYFQSEKYFLENKDQIRRELKVGIPPKLEELELLHEIASSNAVAISIRWGKDYLNSKLNVCDQNYYYKAMELIASKVQNPVFYIFSDCINVVKEHFDFKYPIKFISNYNEIEAMRLMYSCKHFVIANSSYSWWGAYLSDFEEKIVIAPSKWYQDSTHKPDIYLDEMVLVNVN